MKTKRIAFRLDETMARRVEALIPAFSTPGRPATLTDVYRGLILIGLEEREKRGPPSAEGAGGIRSSKVGEDLRVELVAAGTSRPTTSK